MLVLKTSASDYTAFVRSAAVLPTNGKAVKSTVTTVNTAVAAVVATASKVAATATPTKAIVTVASKVTTTNKNTTH